MSGHFSLLLHQISLFLYQINWEKEKVVCDFANMSKKHFVINLNISGDVTRLPGSETMREQLREIFSMILKVAVLVQYLLKSILSSFDVVLNKLLNKPQQQ